MAARFKDVQAERIRLRGLRESDIPHLLAYRIQPEIARYQGWDVDYSLDDATKLVQGTIEAKFGTRGEWYQVGIALADSDELIGDFGVYFESDDTAAIEFGYTLSLDHQGKGLATEALRLLLLLVETTQGIVFAKAITDLRNVPSRKLLARCGFSEAEIRKKDGFYKDEWCDVVECHWHAAAPSDKTLKA